jgi:hypothetical protein
MPKPITYRGQTRKYLELDAESRARDEQGDCTVKAIAILCEVSYAEAHAACEKRGRKPNCGMSYDKWSQVFTDLGYELKPVNRREFMDTNYPGAYKRCKNITTHHPERFPAAWADGNKYLFWSTRHVTAVVDGVNHDWSVGKAIIVNRVFRVEPKA